MRVIAITGGGPELVERVHALLRGGVEVLVREPELPAGLPLDRVILHARMPGALEVATALHLSSTLAVTEWRARFRGPLSVSTHSPEEALAARAAGADAAFLSPIFAARHGRPARGLEGLSGHIALGGVGLGELAVCRRAGAAGAALLSALWHAPDPEAAARAAIAAQYDQTSSS